MRRVSRYVSPHLLVDSNRHRVSRPHQVLLEEMTNTFITLIRAWCRY